MGLGETQGSPLLSIAFLYSSGSQRGRVIPSPHPHLLGASGNVWRCFWLSQLAEGGENYGIPRTETGDAAQHPAKHRTVPMTKYYLVHSVISAKVEKPYFREKRLGLAGIGASHSRGGIK